MRKRIVTLTHRQRRPRFCQTPTGRCRCCCCWRVSVLSGSAFHFWGLWTTATALQQPLQSSLSFLLSLSLASSPSRSCRLWGLMHHRSCQSHSTGCSQSQSPCQSTRSSITSSSQMMSVFSMDPSSRIGKINRGERGKGKGKRWKAKGEGGRKNIYTDLGGGEEKTSTLHRPWGEKHLRHDLGEEKHLHWHRRGQAHITAPALFGMAVALLVRSLLQNRA